MGAERTAAGVSCITEGCPMPITLPHNVLPVSHALDPQESAIEKKWRELGGEQGPLGAAASDETATSDGAGRCRVFQKGALYFHPDAGAHAVLGDMLQKWLDLDLEKGPLGYPVAEAEADGKGGTQRFQHGALYRNPQDGAIYALYGAVHDAWQVLGGTQGLLGYPFSDVKESASKEIRWARFAPPGGDFLTALYHEEKRDAFELLYHCRMDLSEQLFTPVAPGAPTFALGEHPPAPKRDVLVDVKGHRWQTFSAWLARNRDGVRVRHGEQGLFVQFGPDTPPAPGSPGALPLRGGLVRGKLWAKGAKTAWDLDGVWDAGSRTLMLGMAFPIGSDALREAVKAALQADPGSNGDGGTTLEVDYAHAAAVRVAADVETGYTFTETWPLPLHFAADSPVFVKEGDGWQPLSDGSPLWYLPAPGKDEYTYLPTSFKLGFQPDGLPFKPYLYTRTSTVGADNRREYRITLTLLAVPDVGPDELKRLRSVLTSRLSRFVRLRPATDLPATFTLGATGAGDAAALTKGPAVNLADGFPIELDFPAEMYTLLLEQLTGAGMGVLGGVRVDLGGGRQTSIDVRLSVLQMAANVVALTPEPPDEEGGAPTQFTIRNQIRRPVRVSGVTVYLEKTTPYGLLAKPAELDANFPLDLGPLDKKTVGAGPSDADKSWHWDRLDLMLEGAQVDVSMRTARAWVDAVNRTYTQAAASYPLTIDVVNFRTIKEATHPGFQGLKARLLQGERVLDEKLVKEPTWTTEFKRTLDDLSARATSGAGYQLDWQSVYATHDGLPQRLRGHAGGDSDLEVRALPFEDDATRYDVLDDNEEKPAVLQENLERGAVLACLDVLKQAGQGWRLRVRPKS